MIKILMNGCNGRMGQMITGLVNADERAEIAAGVDTYQGIANSYPVYAKIEECKEDIDVVIDFSNASALDGVLSYCVGHQVPVVLCSTGYSPEQLEKIKDASGQTAILKSANMSLGINLLLKLLKDAANVLAPAGYDMEIVERHHNQKLDAPSGTALALADAINEARGQEYEYVFVIGREKGVGKAAIF